MSDIVRYLFFVGAIFCVIIFIEYSQTIFPTMGYDKYFIDEYGYIHGKNCPYRKVPWFTKKHSKYDILIEKEQEICRECLLLEEDKLWELHSINLELKQSSLRYNGASEDYIQKKIKLYK